MPTLKLELCDRPDADLVQLVAGAQFATDMEWCELSIAERRQRRRIDAFYEDIALGFASEADAARYGLDP
jgi:hypothetical protein